MAMRTSRILYSRSSSSPMCTATPRSANSLPNGPIDGESTTTLPFHTQPSARLRSTWLAPLTARFCTHSTIVPGMAHAGDD
eukprot:6126270-Prymnesium_polylepis.1